MKIKTIICILIAINVTFGYSQISDNESRITDLRLSYIFSSISHGGDYFIKNETQIPFGIGLDLTFNLSKRFSSDFGLAFKTTGERIESGFIYTHWGYAGPFHIERRYTFIHLPVHINYKLLNKSLFKILISSGPKVTIQNTNYHSNPDMDGLEHIGSFNSMGGGLEFGLIQWLKIFNSLGIYASQYYGYYFIGDFSDIESIEFRIGLTYSGKIGH